MRRSKRVHTNSAACGPTLVLLLFLDQLTDRSSERIIGLFGCFIMIKHWQKVNSRNIFAAYYLAVS